MSTSATVIGLQWGDEGKGKVIDVLARDAALVVRYQGGANAGHTVLADGKKWVFHLVPTGVLWPSCRSVIGPGVVIDVPALVAEIEDLKARGVSGKLLISDRAHVVFPFHKVLDEAREAGRGKDGGQIGTTKRGIGPCYADKASRIGIRIVDLYDKERFPGLLRRNLDEKNTILKHLYDQAPLAFEPILEQYAAAAESLRPLVADASAVVQEALARKERVLFEGAQGAMLDLDHGTYPFVTSSSTLTDGVAAGAGVPPFAVGRTLGVLKAYTTRVGEGPFPSEIPGEAGARLREAGGEYGATTGRPRRTGWLDLVQLRYATALSGTNGLVLTKLDVLAGQGPIKVCTAYEVAGKRLDRVPADVTTLEAARPVFEEVPGFAGPLDPRSFAAFPEGAKSYVAFIEKRLGLPVTHISTGPERDAFIARGGALVVTEKPPRESFEKLPDAVAIIMDGNGRWAQERGLPRIKGHEVGAESVRAITRECARLGLKELTLYAFSTENWKRPLTEVGFLMELLARYLVQERSEIMENGIVFRAIGELDRLPPLVREEYERTRDMSAGNGGMTLRLALSYGSRLEILEAARKIALLPAAEVEKLGEDDLRRFLAEPGMRDPDLVCRTAGEQRLSNFLLWQASYAELYFTDVCWPDFREKELHAAFRAYGERIRRFGGLVRDEE